MIAMKPVAHVHRLYNLRIVRTAIDPDPEASTALVEVKIDTIKVTQGLLEAVISRIAEYNAILIIMSMDVLGTANLNPQLLYPVTADAYAPPHHHRYANSALVKTAVDSVKIVVSLGAMDVKANCANAFAVNPAKKNPQ